MYTLNFTATSEAQLQTLKHDSSRLKQFKAVVKTLNFLQANPKHPGLQSKPYKSLAGPDGEKIWESYAQQHTPSAYRVFWLYGPNRHEITITAIIPHP